MVVPRTSITTKTYTTVTYTVCASYSGILFSCFFFFWQNTYFRHLPWEISDGLLTPVPVSASAQLAANDQKWTADTFRDCTLKCIMMAIFRNMFKH